MTLKIGIYTVIRTLETRAKRITSSPVTHADVALICKLDEQWSFVGSKVSQHWLWYAYNTKTGGVLAYTFGHGRMKPAVNCWPCSHRLISA